MASPPSDNRPGAPPGAGLSTVITSVAPESGRRRGVLTVTTGLDAGRVLGLAGGVSVLGRAPECTHRFDDRSLSREHARVIGVAGGYAIHDSGSRNGTFVNGARVTAPTVLQDGDRVQLGSETTLRFSLVTSAEEQAMIAVYDAAHKDGLTGVLNRKAMSERLAAEIAFAVRHGTEVSVALFDVDRFKSINDTFGHQVGDVVLRATAQCFLREVRIEDVVARYGGEEFLIIARDVDLPGAHVCADRLRQALENAPIEMNGRPILRPDGTPLRVTASAGVASLSGCGDRRDADTLVAIADKRLYAAKEGGRNRVCSG